MGSSDINKVAHLQRASAKGEILVAPSFLGDQGLHHLREPELPSRLFAGLAHSERSPAGCYRSPFFRSCFSFPNTSSTASSSFLSGMSL